MKRGNLLDNGGWVTAAIVERHFDRNVQSQASEMDFEGAA